MPAGGGCLSLTIVEIATGLELATVENQAEAVTTLAIPGLDPDEVEIVSDNMAALSAWGLSPYTRHISKIAILAFRLQHP